MSRYPSSSYPGAFSPTAPPPPPVPGAPVSTGKRRSALGAAALVIGLLALLLGWIPVLGMAMVLPAMLAILLGTLGFVSAVVSRRTGKALPFVAAFVGVVAFIIPPASTALFALAITPWAYTVGMDQVQIEMEHDLKRQGIASDQAERVSEEVGDALRSFARPSRWREGISAAHRFGLICDDYHSALYGLDEDDEDGRAEAARIFEQNLAGLAERFDADLNDEDIKLIAAHLGRDIERRVSNWHIHQRNQQRIIELHSGVSVDGCDIYGGCGSSCEDR